MTRNFKQRITFTALALALGAAAPATAQDLG